MKIRALLVAAALLTPGFNEAIAHSSDESRVAKLEETVRLLERRIDEMEAALLKVESSRSRAVPASANSRDVANWRRLSREMTMDDVRALLGEPKNVEASSSFTIWQYPNGADVTFFSDKVYGWSEPR